MFAGKTPIGRANKEMSLRFEQRRSLLKVRTLLYDLLNPQRRPKTVKELRQRVSSAVRHFPPLDERGEPLWSMDEFDS
jgi:hypothetical protein